MSWKNLYNDYIVPTTSEVQYTPVVDLSSIREVMVALYYSQGGSLRQTIIFPAAAVTGAFAYADFYFVGSRLYCSVYGSSGKIKIGGGSSGSIVWGSGSGQCNLKLYYR